MGHIKEPKGVDFIIQSEPLTDKIRNEISEFIKNYKLNRTPEVNKISQTIRKKSKLVTA